MATLARGDSLGGRLRWTWLGISILAAHLVDIVEWVGILVAPAYFQSHFVTHSWFLAACVAVGAALALRVIGRPRSPWPCVLIAVTVGSHLLLDHPLLRKLLADAYHQSGGSLEEMPRLFESIAAESWLYGLLAVLFVLARAAAQPACPRRGRSAAGVLAILAIAAAVSRIPALWVTAYVLAAVHSLLLMRRGLTVRLLWNIVPVLPVLALLGVEVWAGRLQDQARRFMDQGRMAEAAALYERALAMPTRSKKDWTMIYLSGCRRRLGDFRGAEALLLQAEKLAECPDWVRFLRATSYLDPAARGTPCFDQERAIGMLEDLATNSTCLHTKQEAQRRLKGLRH